MTQYTYLTNEDIGDQSMEGYDCYDSTDNKMGDVDGVIADESMTPRYLVIDAGGFFSSKQYVVPFGEIARVNDADRRVYFKTLTKDILTSGQYPQYDDQWWETNNHAAWTAHEQQVARAYGRQGTVDYNSDLYRRQPQNTQRLQLMEEQLRANKQRYQAGAVKLGKRIVEQQQTLNVPVTEERVVIERRPVSGEVPARGEVGTEQTIEVPVTREKVTAEKQAFVREEVGVRKEAVQHTEQVQGTVRREELDVKDGEELVSGTAATMDERGRRLAQPEGPAPTTQRRQNTPPARGS